jgi:fatty acid desaturase
MIPLTPLTSARSPDLLLPEMSELSETVDTEEARVPQPRKNVHRSRITYALLTLLTFLVTALAASFIWSAVVGYVLWAVFKAGHFNVST